MDSKRVLSLLGLALRGGNLAVGEEPVEAAARGRDARVILVAADAAENTCRRAEHFAQAGQCLCLRTPFTREDLGMALGRASVALAAVTDTGLANAVVHRLAEGDPGQYGEAAAQMELKYKRARERQLERLSHEKNVRQGKRRAEPPPKPERKPARGPGQNGSNPRNSGRGPSGDGGAPRKHKGAPPRRDGAHPGPGRGSEGAGRKMYGPKSASHPAGEAGRGSGKRSASAPGRRSAPPGDSRTAAGRGRTGGGTGRYSHSRPVKKGKGSFRKRES